jgi:hypothetical protein
MANPQSDCCSSHQWKFFRAGGFDQVQLDTPADLFSLEKLDQKLWVALSCPIAGVEFDQRTLELIDTDCDGHIRVPEMLAAMSWVRDRLKDHDLLLSSGDELPLVAINETTEEGGKLLASAMTILESIGKGESDRITLEDVCDTERIFSQTRFNGDGIITPGSTDDEALKGWIARIIDTLGSETDRSGEEGISAAKLEQFSGETASWLEWLEKPVSGEVGDIPLAEREAAIGIWHGVKAKVEDYFIRCRLAAYDIRGQSTMNATEEQLLSLAPRNLAEADDDITSLPLSAVSDRMELDLEAGLNPAWTSRMATFRAMVVRPLLGETDRLTSDGWERLKELCAAYEVWWGERVETPVSSLGREQLLVWRDDRVTDALKALVDQDLALQSAFESIVDLERLIRYCRDLYPLVNNFVSFRDFYSGRGKGIFQAGTLYLDGRSCEFTVSVADVAKHAVLANLSRVFLVYCDCVRDNGNEKMTIAAAFTNGDSDQLMVGRNGVFYDRQGRDWDATIVRILDHPISIRQAFWSPYKRVGKAVGEQVQKLAAARSRAAEDRAAVSMMQSGISKDAAKPAPPPQTFDAARFAGIFAAIGLAIGAIGTAIASVVTGFFKLPWWQMPLAMIGVMLLISGPSILIAWFKLRQRNLGPILDANGWAVNARARLNIPFGASLTGIPRLPEGSKQTLKDPYAEKKTPWMSYLLLFIVAVIIFMSWRSGFIKIPIKCTVSPTVTAPAK